ncbi:hypothetical protein ES705_00926 [subsurface metagenome]|nr:hypothetical protein [Clostridia bacterium]
MINLKHQVLKISVLILLFVRSFTNLFSDKKFNILGIIDLNPSSLIGLLIILLFIVVFSTTLIRKNSHRLVLIIDRLDLSILFFILLIIVSFFINLLTVNLLTGLFLRELVRLISIFCLYFLVRELFISENDFNFLLKFFIVIFIFPCSFAIYQLIFKKGNLAFKDLNRVFGTFSHPNSFALSLAFFLLILIYFIYFSKRMSNKLLFTLYFILLFVLLLFTHSRNGILFFLFCIFILSVKFYYKRFFTGTIILLIFLVILFFPFIKERWSDISGIGDSIRNFFVFDRFNSKDSFDWRLMNSRYLLNISLARPIFGYGLGSVSIVNPLRADAHNDYLKILVEVGIIGLLGYIFVIGNIFKKLFNKIRSIEVYKYRFFVYLIFYFFIGYIIFSFFENYFIDTLFQYYFWSILALVGNFNKYCNKYCNDKESTEIK